MKDHLWSAFVPTHNAYNTIFHNSIRKHGIENFEWEIVYQSNDTHYILNEMEEYFIKKFDSYFLNGNGYNMSYGGQGSLGRILSEGTKTKISKAHIGKIWSEEQLKNLRKSKQGLPKTQKWKNSRSKNMTGKKFSQEHKDNMAKVRYKKWKIEKPNGEYVIVLGLKRFCKDNNLNSQFITKLKGSGRGNIKQKGFKGYFAELILD